MNCDHFSSSALHPAVTNLSQKLYFSFNSVKSVIFIFAWILWFWTGDARAMKLSTSTNIFISKVLLFFNLLIMDFLRQSTHCVGAAPVTLVSFGMWLLDCVVLDETVVWSNLTETLRVHWLTFMIIRDASNNMLVPFCWSFVLFFTVNFLKRSHSEQLTHYVFIMLYGFGA